MIRRNAGTVVVATTLVALLLLALILARAQGHLPVLALDLTEHLFGIVLAVFVFERMLAWREERRWLAAKNWLYMILLETIDDLLKELLPQAVPHQQEEKGVETNRETAVYEITGERIHFGEVVAYSPLELLVSPDDKDLQSYIIWYAKKLEPPRYADLARVALSDTRDQIRDVFGSSGQLLEADITARLMGFEQAIAAAIRHLDTALGMREGKPEDVRHLDNEESASQRVREADDELAFVAGIIVESVVSPAMKPKAWLEEQMHSQGGQSPFGRLQASDRAGMGSMKRHT
jgi:hypothetical protein